MKIALVQTTAERNAQENLTRLKHYAGEAARQGCSVICFPECSLTGYFPEEAEALGLEQGHPLLLELVPTARELGIDILAGFMERHDTGFFITHGLFRRDGGQYFYRKTHLGAREKDFFVPGEELRVLTLTEGTKIGIALCVETHYPEITQTYALREAKIVFAPHAVPRISGERQAVWGKYIPARSYDNRVFLACCNQWSEDRYGGGCLVTGPRGETLADFFREEEAMLICGLPMEALDCFHDPENPRSRHNFPRLRRKELYE